jgi:hypothetical protein
MSEEIAEGTAPEAVEETQSEPASDEAATPDIEAAEPDSTEEVAEEEEPEEWKFLTGKAGVKELDRTGKERVGKEFAQAKTALSQLSKELKTLKDTNARLEAASREREEPKEEDPDLKVLNAQVTALEDELKEHPKVEAQLAEKLIKADKAVNILEYELSRADDMDKPALQARLDMAVLRLEQASEKYHSHQSIKKTLPQEIARAKKEVGRFAEVENERARQKQEANVARARILETFPQEVDGYRSKHFNAFLPKNDEINGLSTRLVDALMAMDMWRAGQNGLESDEIDVEGLVKEKLSVLKAFGEAYSRNRLSKVPKPAPQVNGKSTAPAKVAQVKSEDKLAAARERLRVAFDRASR